MENDYQVLKFVEAKTSRMYLLDNNILLIEEQPGFHVTLELAMENIKFANQISEGKNCGLLVDSRKMKGMTKEARDLYARKDSMPCIMAMAILINSPFTKIMANFFLAFSKPEFPTCIFTSKEEAIRWLKTYLTKTPEL
ncbi:MAG: hypothetical protein H7A23_00470 [Leptospiraceae bacterium]|nr:hypothetical protein [Leptospiraceae bacterium]MCP5493004.1 hypothetical protein [Leptospiraceae bacterium]